MSEEEFAFLFTAVDNLKIFINSGAGVRVHVSTREAERMVVTPFSVDRKDAFYCAVF